MLYSITAQMARIQLLLDPSTATITTTTTASTENDDSDVMIVLPDTNAFLRRVLYEQIEARFNTRVMVKKNEANKLCIYKMEGMLVVIIKLMMMLIVVEIMIMIMMMTIEKIIVIIIIIMKIMMMMVVVVVMVEKSIALILGIDDESNVDSFQ